MSMEAERMRLARAIHDAAHGHAEAVRASHQLGEVLNASPLRIALIDSDRILDEDEVDVGAWAQTYDGGAGIADGDTVVLHRLSGYWVVTEVLGDAGPTEAIQNLIDVRSFAANVGNGSDTSFVITHSLGTRDVLVQAYRNSPPWDAIACDVKRTSASAVTVEFGEFWRGDAERGDLSDWSWWGGGPADGSAHTDTTYGTTAVVSAVGGRKGRIYKFQTPDAGHPHAKVYLGLEQGALGPQKVVNADTAAIPDDVSGTYQADFYIPSAVSVTDWINIFQWKEKRLDTNSYPVWWVNVVPCSFGDLASNPFQAECQAAGADDPAIYLNNWIGVTGGDRSGDPPYAIMPVPQDAWFTLRAVIDQGTSITFSVDGEHFDTALDVDYDCGPLYPATSMEWIFGVGCYVAAAQGPIYVDNARVAAAPSLDQCRVVVRA